MTALGPEGMHDSPPTRNQRLAAWVGTVSTAALYIIAVGLLQGGKAAAEAAGFLGAASIGVGKLIIFASLHPDCALSSWNLAVAASISEIGLAAILATHLDLLYRIPRLGPRLHVVRIRSAEMLKANPWLRRLAGVGVGIYTALPFAGTGPLGSTFFGQMAGLSRRTMLLGIAGGSLASSFLMAWGAVALAGRMEALMRHPAMTVAGVVLFLALVGWLGKAMARPPQASEQYDDVGGL